MSLNRLAGDLDHVLEHTHELWGELRGERIFITGGTGFFGCWLLESFAWANDHLGLNARALVLTRNLEAFRKKAPHLAGHPAIQFCSGDVRTFEFPAGSYSHIIHAATEFSTRLSVEAPLTIFDSIVDGTHHTLDFARHCGARKFLLTSSGAVYGKQPPEITHIPEEFLGAPDPSLPESAYGEGKRAAETLCTMHSKQFGLEVKIARCFAFVGPYLPLNINSAIGNFIGDGLKGGPIIVKGDGTPLRSYLYAADLVIWLWTILFKGQNCRPYNVGSEDSLSISDVANHVAKSFQPRVAIVIQGKPDPRKLLEQYVPDIMKVKDEFGLKLTIPLPLGIKKTIDYINNK